METKEIIIKLLNDFTETQLEEFVKENYIHKEDVQLSDFSDDDILQEIGNRSWSKYEAEEIYDEIKDDLDFSVPDIQELFDGLSNGERACFIEENMNSSIPFDSFEVKTLYDELKVKALIELYNKFTLEQLEYLVHK